MATKPPDSTRTSGRAPRVVYAVVICVLVAFMLLCTASFILGQRTKETNLGGALGYYLAFGLNWLFGKSSIFLPFVIALTALVAWRRGRHGRKLAGFLLWVTGLFLSGALLTYHIHTLARWSLTGRLGGVVAGMFSCWFGLGAYTFAVLAALWGTNVWLKRPVKRDLVQTVFIVLLGLFTILFLAHFGERYSLLGPSRAGRLVLFPLGGTTGLGIIHGLWYLLNRMGTLLVLVGGAIITLAVFTKIRLPELGWLRAGALAFWGWLRRLFQPGPKPPRPEPAVTPEPTPVERPPEPTAAAHDADPEPKPDSGPSQSVPVKKPRRLPISLPKFDLSEFQKVFLDQLDKPTEKDRVFKDRKESEQEAVLLLDKLRQFGIDGRVSDILSGPMITRYEFEPAPGVKIGSIASRSDDISLALAAERIRILAPIPGKNAVGIEVPNKERRTVYLREVLTSEPFREERSPLGFALGTTITGEPYSADLRGMPHILIAGTTGSGKSVCINSLIASIIYRSSPRDVRFLTIDPKQLELPVYNPIPHLLGMTTIDPDRAVRELGRIVDIMEFRYGEFANLGVRDIIGYNQRAEADGFPKKPYIVVIIDELADLMLRAPTEIEMRITRLAQMSRAVGIHLVLATQRPSVDVITGLIKANFPCRIAFQVASKTDSRTILDMNGAESLLGRGDMLFLPPGKGEPVRLHGSFASDRAARRIVDLWAVTWLTELLSELVENPADRARKMVELDVVDVLFDKEKSGIKKKLEDLRTILPEDVVDNLMSRKYYDTLPEESPEILQERKRSQTDENREIDEKFGEAAQIVVRHREASVSMLQRRLDIGWARAGRIIDQLEQAGIVGPYVGSKSRKVLVDSEAGLQRLLSEMTQGRRPEPGPGPAAGTDDTPEGQRTDG